MQAAPARSRSLHVQGLPLSAAIACLCWGTLCDRGHAWPVVPLQRQPASITQGCPTALQPLVRQMLKGLGPYVDRALIRAGQPETTVVVISEPNFESLPLKTTPSLEALFLDSFQQVFFTLLQRQYDGTQAQLLQTYHWAFFAQRDRTWSLMRLYQIEGPYPPTPDPLPAAQPSHQSPLAQAMRQWLQDCAARQPLSLSPELPSEP